MTYSGHNLIPLLFAAAVLIATLIFAVRKIAAIRRRAQAKAVSAVVVGLPLWETEHAQDVHHEYTDRIRLIVTNKHAKPISVTYVEVSPHVNDMILDEESHTFLFHGPGVIQGRETGKYANEYMSRRLAPTSEEWLFRFRVVFCDAAGIKWMLSDEELTGPLDEAEGPRIVRS